jgi:hypothetical protein
MPNVPVVDVFDDKEVIAGGGGGCGSLGDLLPFDTLLFWFKSISINNSN